MQVIGLTFGETWKNKKIHLILVSTSFLLLLVRHLLLEAMHLLLEAACAFCDDIALSSFASPGIRVSSVLGKNRQT